MPLTDWSAPRAFEQLVLVDPRLRPQEAAEGNRRNYAR
jgi:hypothetical protein